MSPPSPRLVVGGMAAAAGLVAVTTLLSRVVGLGRWAVFSHSVGTTCLGQVYASANQVPNVLYEIAVGGALAAVAVPLVAAMLNVGREADADRTASALLTWAMTLLVPLSLLVAVAADPLAGLLLGSADGCDQQPAREAGALMLVVFAPQIALYGLGVVLTGVLQAHRRFLAAALAPLLSSLVVIATYLLFATLYDATVPVQDVPRSGVLLLAGGTTLGVVALSVPLLLPSVRAGVRLRPTWRFPSGTASRARVLALAGVLAVVAQQVTVLGTVLASNRVGVGTINVYTYVQTIYLLPYAVLVVPLATVAFPRLTAPDEAGEVLLRTARAVLAAALLGALGLVAVRRDIGAVFLSIDAGSAGPGRAALDALPVAVAAFAPGLVGFGLAALLTRALYAVGPPTRAAACVAAGWAVAAVGPLVLLVLPGRADVAVALVVLGAASSLGMTLSAVLLLGQVRAAWEVPALRGAGRTAAAVTLAGVAVVLAREALSLSGSVPVQTGWGGALVMAGATGVVLLLAVLAALRAVDAPTYASVVGALTRRGGGD
ncbi:murein biosynthesis integral membrane protein MurJ [Ornithinimicrobium sediminis]|uniref:murein biosynthesis integral membrane protein MurJ n=1 Tax=Ornithinimicrobium sediminis TaxID=2904603 RepID=UPI001E3B3575|nr:lipid II flippase MurJ [Ornithinimicrobium sediminis]MCE0488344.1 virulence factor MviN [Ornithinimicrobium sediminis]